MFDYRAPLQSRLACRVCTSRSAGPRAACSSRCLRRDDLRLTCSGPRVPSRVVRTPPQDHHSCAELEWSIGRLAAVPLCEASLSPCNSGTRTTAQLRKNLRSPSGAALTDGRACVAVASLFLPTNTTPLHQTARRIRCPQWTRRCKHLPFPLSQRPECSLGTAEVGRPGHIARCER